MATKFLEPGGDADFVNPTTGNGFWGKVNSTPTIATDFVHGSHIKSIKHAANTTQYVQTANSIVANAGARTSVYFYFVALPTNSSTVIFSYHTTITNDQDVIQIRITSGGILQVWRGDGGTPSQIGTDGSTLSTGQWYRISFAYTITSTTVNRFELFKDGISDISITNATIFAGIMTSFRVGQGNGSVDSTFDFRSSDHYVDDSTALTDPGNIWVTAKRPNANGTTNGFTTQIGSGGSGYGSGHSPQVNERPLSKTNGWSMIGAGSAITEEYNIENLSTGDFDLTGATIIDYLGWVSADTLNAETASIIVNNVTSNISLTTTTTLFTKIAGSSTYPAGTGSDIGIITTTALTTVSLYECGVIVAYTPVASPATAQNTSSAFFDFMGPGQGYNNA